MVDNFFKKLYSDDIIYHYTKASTAIDFILYEGRLRFNRSRNSSDPIESRKADRRTVYHGFAVDNLTTPEQSQDENELHLFVNDMEDQFLQICFCQNRMGEDFASPNYMSNFEGHEELFGFTKLRMWDQYADRFTGVCIAFSKEKIISLNKQRLNLIEGDVKYLTFQDLTLKKVGNIQGNHLANVGKERYKEQLEQLVKESFFLKHLDYSGEAEYRIGTLYNKDKCTIEIIRGELSLNRSMILDISGCIEAIFVSGFVNNKQKNDLLEYAKKNQIEIIEMDWRYNSFLPKDYKAIMEFLSNVWDN